MVKRTMMPAHTPALKIPAIAEHPATNTNKHANKNSNTGFIKQLLLIWNKKLCRLIDRETRACGKQCKGKFFSNEHLAQSHDLNRIWQR